MICQDGGRKKGAAGDNQIALDYVLGRHLKGVRLSGLDSTGPGGSEFNTRHGIPHSGIASLLLSLTKPIAGCWAPDAGRWPPKRVTDGFGGIV